MIILSHIQANRATQPYGCLLTCIVMVLRYLDIEIDEQRICDLIGFDEQRGTYWWSLPLLEETLPVKVTLARGTEQSLIARLARAAPPIIVTTVKDSQGGRKSHAVVVADLEGDTIYFYDPAQPTGPISLDRHIMIENWQRTGGRQIVAIERRVDYPGFIYDANGNPQDVYSLAPERQTNFGRIVKVTGILLSGNTIADAQAESNTLAGLYRAHQNIRFPHIRVPLFNNRFLEPATQDYFAINLAAEDTIRGLVWESKEFITTEVSYEINVEKGYLLVEVTGEASTYGPDGVAGPYPSRLPPSSLSDDNPPDYIAEWPADPPPWGDPTEGSEDWEPAAGAWVNDNGPGDVWKFLIWQGRLFAVAAGGDGVRGISERTGAATWTKLDPTGVGTDVYDAIVFNNRIWAIAADDQLYSTITPENDGWQLEWSCPGNETFNILSPLNSYDGYLYLCTDDTVANTLHFHQYSPAGGWNLDFLTALTPGGGVRAWDFVRYGQYWFSGSVAGSNFRYYQGGSWVGYDDDLDAGKFTFCRGMYFLANQLNTIWRGTGGGWVEDYDPGQTFNWIALSAEGDNLWVGAEIDAANIQVHTRWWGEAWRSILPSCADTWAGGAIRGPDDYVYLGGNNTVWQFVPA